MDNKRIGKVSATEKSPTTADSFSFWVADSEIVAPFDIVEAPNRDGSTTYGQVTSMSYVSDSPSHLGNYVSSDFGSTEEVANTPRLGTTYVEADVLTNDQRIFMPLRDGEPVCFAGADGVREALGLDQIAEKHRIPGGFINLSNGLSVDVSLDVRFLIGPEGAHMNMSGISGLAAKTSYVMFLIRALQQRCDDAAFIVLNVKGQDLLHLHEENDELTDEDRKDWERCGLEPTPFDSVKYFFPFQEVAASNYALTAASAEWTRDLLDQGIAANYVYTFDQDKGKLALLFSNIDDPAFTIESIINEIENSREFEDIGTWGELLSHVKGKGQKGATGDKHIHPNSWNRFYRLLSLYMGNTAGIYQSNVSEYEGKHQIRLQEEIAKIRAGDTYVVDIANLSEPEQCLVFGDIVNTVYRTKLGELGLADTMPRRVIIFVDELNKYAPATSKGSPIIRELLEITERGRSLGVVLFAAQQFKSAVHDRVKGNCGTHAFGRTNVTEISKTDYKSIPKAYAHMMTRLNPGDLVLEHPPYPRLLKVGFPMPCYYQPKGEPRG